MPFRLGNIDPKWADRAKIQFTTSATMPYRIYEACKATGILSNTVYCQMAVCEALSRDLGIPLEDLVAELPTARGTSAWLRHGPDQKAARFGGARPRVGPGNTIEEVRR